MFLSQCHTKTVWSLSCKSLLYPEKIAGILAEYKLDAIRCVNNPLLKKQIGKLREELSKATKINDAPATGLYPMVFSPLGRRCVLQVPDGEMEVEEKQLLTLYVMVDESHHKVTGQYDEEVNTPTLFVSCPDMLEDIQNGTKLSLGFGEVEVELQDIKREGGILFCRAFAAKSGRIFSGMDATSVSISKRLFPLIKEDEEALKTWFWGHADYIIIHGLESAEELAQLRKYLFDQESQGSLRHPTVPAGQDVKNFSAPVAPKLILKLDTAHSLDLMHASIDLIDGILLSRAELGLDIHPHELPILQKKVFKLCNQRAKIILVASEFMASMRVNPNPTRAEVSDLAHTIADGADGIVLSEEVCDGAFPSELARYTVDSIQSSEKAMISDWKELVFEIKNDDDAVAYGALNTAKNSGAKAIACITEGGYTASRLASLRTPLNIVTITYNLNIMRQLHLVRSVHCVALETEPALDQILNRTNILLSKILSLKKGDRYLFVSLSASPISNRQSNLFTLQEVE